MLLVSSLCHLGLLAPWNPTPIITRQGDAAGQGRLCKAWGVEVARMLLRLIRLL